MDTNSEFVLTKSALLKPESARKFECIVYESHKAKNKQKLSRTNKQSDPDRLDVKKVSHEVVKFGIAGMSASERRKTKDELLLKLKAKAPRKDCINYKELKEQKMREREEQETLRDDPINLMFKKTSKKKIRIRVEKERKQKNNILEAYGKPGQIGAQKKRRRK